MSFSRRDRCRYFVNCRITGRLFLGGLLAGFARLRFAGNASIKLLSDRKEAFIIGRKQCLNCLCQPTGQAQLAASTTFAYKRPMCD